MTDEEMAVEYAENLKARDFIAKTKEIVAYFAFLAGLKAGRPEWHYVKDGDLPKDEDWKWCISYRGYCYVAKYEEMFVCWTNQEYSEVMQPYAWKEIVLPELKESK